MNKQQRNQKMLKGLSFKEVMSLKPINTFDDMDVESNFFGQVGRSRPRKK